jgi:hypothetical protein
VWLAVLVVGTALVGGSLLVFRRQQRA